jgi:hypothetical protein
MMNTVSKILVMVHVGLSLLGLTWALALFFLAPDWGFKQPRMEATERVPSELDKRIAAAKQALKARDTVLPGVEKAHKDATLAMDRFAQNHLFYRAHLEELRSGEGAIKAKEVKYKDGELVLEAPGAPRVGKPQFDDVPGIDKSYLQYRKELTDTEQGLYKQIQVVGEEVRDWIAKNNKVTFQLNGMDDAGKKVRVGLYDLLDLEAQMQTRIRFEKDYLQPQWADALEQAGRYAERRAYLEETLERLKKDLGKTKK